MTSAALAQLEEQLPCKQSVARSNRAGGTILSAHQPCYMPWLGYFAKIAAADQFVIFDAVPFSRHDYTNRVQVKTRHGAQWLTVPIKHGHGERVMLKDARIVHNGWQRQHLRTIEGAYARAPYFDKYFPVISTSIGTAWDTLEQLTTDLLVCFLAWLGIETPIERASGYQFVGQKSALVLNMCEQLGVSEYIFGSQGRNYADVTAFEAAGIKVRFQDYQHPVYPQLHGAFVPGLSVIDLLMNCGPESAGILNSQP